MSFPPDVSHFKPKRATTEEVLMTFGDMTRKKEDIVVDASDLEAEAANDSCQRYANSPLESVESSI